MGFITTFIGRTIIAILLFNWSTFFFGAFMFLWVADFISPSRVDCN
jgi:hypothetical protein